MSKSSNQQKVHALAQWLKWIEVKRKYPRKVKKYNDDDID
jgi:hypothetical protein